MGETTKYFWKQKSKWTRGNSLADPRKPKPQTKRVKLRTVTLLKNHRSPDWCGSVG